MPRTAKPTTARAVSPSRARTAIVPVRFSDLERAEAARRAQAASGGPYDVSTYIRELALGHVTAVPATEELRTLTARLRTHLDAIDDAIADAQDDLSEIETAAGLVREDGGRIDDPAPPARRASPRRA